MFPVSYLECASMKNAATQCRGVFLMASYAWISVNSVNIKSDAKSPANVFEHGSGQVVRRNHAMGEVSIDGGFHQQVLECAGIPV